MTRGLGLAIAPGRAAPSGPGSDAPALARPARDLDQDATSGGSWLPHLQAVAAVALMSALFPTMRIALREVDARTLFLARFGIAALAILPLWCVVRPQLRGITPRLWVGVLALAVLRGPAHQLLLGHAAARIPSAVLALLSATAPLHAAWLGALLLRERLRAAVVAALALAGGGVLVRLVGVGPLHGPAWSGTALGLAAAVIAGGSVVAARAMRGHWGAWENATVSVVAGAVLSLPLGSLAMFHQLSHAGMATWCCILYQALAVQILGVWLLFAALTRLPAGTAAVYQLIGLVATAWWGRRLLGERADGLEVLAMVLTAIAVLVLVSARGGPAAATWQASRPPA